MEHSDIRTIEPDAYSVNLAIIIAIAFNALGLTLAILSDFLIQQLFAVIFFSTTSLMILVPILNFEFIRRPKSIILDDPLRLDFRIKGSMEVQLEEIEWMCAFPGDTSTFAGRTNRRGGMGIRNRKHPVPLSYEVARDIMDLYRERLGRDPPHPPRRD